MALPRSFADDGASGASGGGSAIGPDVVKDFGTPPASTSTPPAAAPSGGRGGTYETGQVGYWGNPLGPTIRSGGGPTTSPQPGLAPRTPSRPAGSSGTGGNLTGVGNGSPIGLAFSRGGAIPDDDDTDGSPQQDQISRALDTVDQVLAFGRKQHGLGGGDNEGIPQQQAMNTDGFRQSDNMEDRRDETSPGPSPSRTKFDDLSDKISGAVSNITASYNPMSQQAGINDIGSQQQPASGQAAGAIDTSDEENQ